MKLTDDQIGRIESLFSVSPIPEDEPIVDQLLEVFGEHTFYLGESGLVVWDRIDENGAADVRLVAVQLASWSDGTHSAMQVHEPVNTGIVADMGAEDGESDDEN